MNSQITSAGNILLHFDTCYGMQLNFDTLNVWFQSISKSANCVSKNLFESKKCKTKLTTVRFEEGGLKVIVATAVITSLANAVVPDCYQWIKQLLQKHSFPTVEKRLKQGQHGQLVSNIVTCIHKEPAKEMRNVFNNCTFVFGSPEEIIKSKNAAYKATKDDENFKALGFTDEHKFLINNSNISDYIDCQSEKTPTRAYKKLILISPVIDRNSQKQWFFASSDEKSTAYKMEDLSFQESTSEGKYQFREGTEIVATICIKETKGNIERSVLEVYSIDGKEIKPKPKDFKLDEPINVIHQPDLFSF